MTIANGHRHLAIPGPTNMPDEVLNALHSPSVDIYGGVSEDASRSCLKDLKKVFGTKAGKVYIYACNGHGAWEAALTNVLSRGDKVLVLVSGLFPVVWGENAKKLGLPVTPISGTDSQKIVDTFYVVTPELVERAKAAVQ